MESSEYRAGHERPVTRRGRRVLPVWLVPAVLLVTLLASVLAGNFVFWTVRSAFAGARVSLPEPLLTPAAPQGTPPPGSTPAQQVSAGKCDALTQRMTVLLTGIDERSTGDGQGPARTDTMMLLSLDPVHKTAVMLSIPRDVWATIPDFGYGRKNDRINTANFYGDAYDYPGGGPALAVKTVELNLGIHIDAYARLNFTAFEDFVDRIGGIDLQVPEDIYDNEYPTDQYQTEIFQLGKGLQHLDGPTALKYARTRHTPGGDFDRAKRQQQVIMAVRDKVSNLNLLPSLLSQAPELYAMLQSSVRTNLSLDAIACLAQHAQQVPRENIRSASIDENYTSAWKTPEGWDVLVPDHARISQLMVELFPAVR